MSIDLFGTPPAGITEKEISALFLATCATAKKKNTQRIAVRFVNDRAMRKLNKKFRGIDATTDVLSFRYSESQDFVTAIENDDALGDIVISLPQIRRQAKKIGRSSATECVLMIVHGTLHLLGYDHSTRAQEKKMFALQQEVLHRTNWF